MADVEGRVVKPNVGFDADTAHRESGVKGNRAPVVIVGVNRFLRGGGWLVTCVPGSGTSKRERKRRGGRRRRGERMIYRYNPTGQVGRIIVERIAFGVGQYLLKGRGEI